MAPEATRKPGDGTYDAVLELRERVSRLEERVDYLSREIEELASIRSDIARLSQKVDDVDKKLDAFMNIYAKQLTSNHKMLKFVTVILAMILSFLAAIFGFHWTPP